MNRTASPPHALDRRSRLVLMLTAVVGPLALLQRTGMAPLPHSVDDFVGGVAVGLGMSVVFAWAAARA